MPVTSITVDQLVDVDWEGTVNEDVLQTLFDVSPEVNAFVDLVGSGSADNPYYSWVTDKLAKPDGNPLWVVDGADATILDNKTGVRLGNNIGTLEHAFSVSHLADAADTIGYSEESMYQNDKAQKELRRIENNALLGAQGNQEGDKATDAPGIPAGFGCICKKHDPGNGFTGGTFANGVWTGHTAGTGVSLTEAMVRDAAQAAWMEGGNPGYFFSHANAVRGFSEYLFTSSARIATLTGETGNNRPTDALGTVQAFLSDFGSTLELMADRWIPTYASSGGAAGDACMVFLIDPAYVEVARMRGYQSEPLAKSGHASKRMVSVATGLRNLNPDASIAIPDVLHATAVTQA